MGYIVKVHGRNEETEQIMLQILELAKTHTCIDAYSEQSTEVSVQDAIDERLDYLAEHNIEQLKSLAKCELIRRKMTYKRITKFPPPEAYKNIADRSSMFSFEDL